VGLAADYLACAVAEIADISERRTSLLLDSSYNRGLPPSLAARPGVSSGLMMAQYTSAALVSENKVLAHPSSVDSIPTSGNAEDHVAMSTTAARKLRTVLGNAQAVVAIELLVAAQAADWRAVLGAPPRREGAGGGAGPGPGGGIAEGQAGAARFRANLQGERWPVAGELAPATFAAYQTVRGETPDAVRVPPLVEDRYLAEDIRQVRERVESGEVVRQVEAALGRPLRASRRLTFADEPV
jgi:histidine ammonia-lyase